MTKEELIAGKIPATSNPEYHVWYQMKDRCSNKNNCNYHNYGARGIKVCDRWQQSFQNFIEDMGFRPSSKHSIDRIDNNGNYEPKNCRWATKSEQANNTRQNSYFLVDGEKLTQTQASKKLGFKTHNGVGLRIKMLGWDQKKALTTPIKKINKLVYKNENPFQASFRLTGKKRSSLVSGRLKKGWTKKEAFTTPKRKFDTKTYD